MTNNNGFVLGMDIGGTNTRSAFIDNDKNVHHFNIVKSNELFGDNAVSNFVDYIGGLIKEADLPGPLLAISAGFPAAVDQNRGKIISTPNLKGLNNIEMADILKQKFEIPAFVSRDACMLLFYDMYANNLPKDAIIIGCYFGTGIGNGVYINGKLLTGKNGVACELGHIPVYGVETICGCGNKGCTETIASGRHLFQLHQQHFPDVLIADIFEKYGSHRILQDYVRAMAIPIAAEINIFDPHYTILGGGVLQMKGFPKKEFEAAVLEHTRKPYPACNLELIYTVEAKMNGVIGAGILGFEHLEEAVL